MPDSRILKKRLEETPLPPRAFVTMKEAELGLLNFHELAQTELQRRKARKTAKKTRDLQGLLETTAPLPEGKGKDAEFREMVDRLFGE